MDKRAVDTLIEQTYQSLPPKLQRAARYAIDNPKAMALNSMRSSAAEAGLPASAMHRLARTLGFDGYEAMRAVYRDWLAQGRGMFAERATALQKRGAANESERLVGDIVQAETLNLAQVTDPRTLAALKAAHDLLRSARHIHVAGLRSLFPAAFYFNYACNMFMPNVSLLSGVGGTFSDDLRHAGRDDVLVIFSYEPYARDSVSAARYARAQGMQIIAVTDSAVSPIASQAAALIVVPNATPAFFPSVVPAMAIAQTLVALLIASGEQASLDEIERSETQLRDFSVYLKDPV
ncbi:MAG: MurR/RpiR family transcriptional regulator [Burkholderiaceae bacterium]